jgi:hypothetical protein
MWSIRLALFLATACSTIAASYSVTPIPLPAGLGNPQMYGINNSGQVAGAAGVSGMAFIGSTAGSTLIPVPVDWSSYALAINSAGQVAGYGAGANYVGFTATVLGITTIPVPAAMSYAIPVAINDSGLVGGFGANGSFTRAFVGNTMIPIPSGWNNSGLHGVNNSGQVAGFLGGGANDAPQQAFIGTAAGATPIPFPAGWNYSVGVGINNSGTVIGYGSGPGTPQFAFYYTSQGTTILPMPPGASELSFNGFSNINDSGVIVGASDAGAWIWSSTQGSVLLNTLVPAGWQILDVFGISNNGLILGLATFNGGNRQYVMISPYSCFVSINPPSIVVNTTAGNGSFAVATGNGCAWTATANDPWITLTSGASGSGNGTVTFDIGADAGGQPRTGTITINGAPANQTFSILQADVPPPAPTLITPVEGASGISTTPTFTWTASSRATSYDVYFGPSSAPVVANVTTTSYSPGTLAPNTTYYWQIGARNAGGSTISGTGVFTTAAIPNNVAAAALRNSGGNILAASYPSSVLTNMGGLFASDPSAAQDISGNTLLVARDNFNGIWTNGIFINAYGVGVPGQWQLGGGVIQGVPAITVAGSTQWVASRDAYSAYWLVSHSQETGFGEWVPLAGVFATDPAITSCGDGTIYVVGKDFYNALWSGRYIPGIGFQGFVLGGGVVEGNPSVSCGSDSAVYIAVRDNYNSNWVARVSGNTWTGWFNGGAVTNIDTRIAALGGSLAIAILDSTGAVYRTTFTEGTGNGWQPWISVGGVLADIAPAGVNGELFFLGRAPNGDLWWWQQNSNQWSWIGNNGVAAGALASAPR